METDLEVFRACADETRLRVLLLLRARELCVCELVEVLAMAQGKVSRHLAVLKRAGLVRSRREGTWIYYALCRPTTGLQRQLHTYLGAARLAHTLAVDDLQRLDALAAKGQICIPRKTRRTPTIKLSQNLCRPVAPLPKEE